MTVTAGLFVCPVCGEVRRDRGQGREPLCPAAGVRHPDRDAVQPAPPKSTNRPKIMSAGRPVPMVRVTATWEAP
jgi:hypothetical protein